MSNLISVVVRCVFNLVVDYSRPINDSIAAGNHRYNRSEINDKNFPPVEHEQGKKNVQFTLYRFCKIVDSCYVIADMERDGMRPATLRELLAFSEVNPELQELPLISLGSIYVSHIDDHRVVYMRRCRSQRGLDLRYCYGRWRGYCRFLAVSK